jgi:hypothetical protein
MNSPLIKRAFVTAALTPALLLVFAPAPAAAQAAAKPQPLILSCNVKTPEGLSYTVIRPGKGERPNAGSKVTVNYKGMLTTDGTEFDSGQAAQFPVGGVIPGFAQGLQLMQTGGSYRQSASPRPLAMVQRARALSRPTPIWCLRLICSLSPTHHQNQSFRLPNGHAVKPLRPVSDLKS